MRMNRAIATAAPVVMPLLALLFATLCVLMNGCATMTGGRVSSLGCAAARLACAVCDAKEHRATAGQPSVEERLTTMEREADDTRKGGALALYVNDGAGAAEFKRQAEQFARETLAQGSAVDIESFAPKAHREVNAIFERHAARGHRAVAIFCHGWRDRLQTGHSIYPSPSAPNGMGTLAGGIAKAATRDVRVALYACSTGGAPIGERGRLDALDGEGGFADILRDCLGYHGCRDGWVDAHALAGHTTREPFVRRFYTDGDDAPSDHVGGEWLIAPRSPQWNAWTVAMLGPMRFRLPWLTTEDVRAIVR